MRLWLRVVFAMFFLVPCGPLLFDTCYLAVLLCSYLSQLSSENSVNGNEAGGMKPSVQVYDLSVIGSGDASGLVCTKRVTFSSRASRFSTKGYLSGRSLSTSISAAALLQLLRLSHITHWPPFSTQLGHCTSVLLSCPSTP